MQLKVSNLNQYIQGKCIFKNVDFDLNTGEMIALIGRNGAGKTTLMQTIMGIRKVEDGEISIDGIDIIKNRQYYNDIIFLPDRFDYFLSDKLDKVLKYYEISYPSFDREKFREIQEEIDIKFDYNKNLSTLSKGQLTICAALLALSTKANFILLDEPYDGIDVINAKKLNGLLNMAIEEGRGIMISSHRLDILAKMTTRTLFIEEGDGVKEFQEDNNRNYHKYQIVVKDKLPQEIQNIGESIVISSIGRVHIILANADKEYLEYIFDKANIVQYDELNIVMEDIFLWQEKKKGIK